MNQHIAAYAYSAVFCVVLINAKCLLRHQKSLLNDYNYPATVCSLLTHIHIISVRSTHSTSTAFWELLAIRDLPFLCCKTIYPQLPSFFALHRTDELEYPQTFALHHKLRPKHFSVCWHRINFGCAPKNIPTIRRIKNNISIEAHTHTLDVLCATS